MGLFIIHTKKEIFYVLFCAFLRSETFFFLWTRKDKIVLFSLSYKLWVKRWVSFVSQGNFFFFDFSYWFVYTLSFPPYFVRVVRSFFPLLVESTKWNWGISLFVLYIIVKNEWKMRLFVSVLIFLWFIRK